MRSAKNKTRQITQPNLTVAPRPEATAETPPLPIGRPLLLTSLTRIEAVEKKRNRQDFLFNGLRLTLNRAEADLLVALAENVPGERKLPEERARIPDALVDWKHRDYLMDRLGITEACYRSRLGRLRRFFKENFGTDLILTDRKREARLRLGLRRNPGYQDLTGSAHSES